MIEVKEVAGPSSTPAWLNRSASGDPIPLFGPRAWGLTATGAGLPIKLAASTQSEHDSRSFRPYQSLETINMFRTLASTSRLQLTQAARVAPQAVRLPLTRSYHAKVSTTSTRQDSIHHNRVLTVFLRPITGY